MAFLGVRLRHERAATRARGLAALIGWFLFAASSPVRASDVRIVEVTNGTNAVAAKLSISFGATGGALYVVPATVVAPSGCPLPGVTINVAQDTATLDWGAACVGIGKKVTFVASTSNAGPLTFANAAWFDATGANIGAVIAAQVAVRATLGGAQTANVPITATVHPPGGNPGAQQIGMVTADSQFGGIGRAEGDFVFAAPYRWVDHGYDFQWVNVFVAYIKDGVPQTTNAVLNIPAFPGIDPSPADGALPFYFNEQEWTSGIFRGNYVIHEECVRSRFRDNPTLDDGEFLFFKAFLVIDDLADVQIGAKDFCVLDGFSWYHNGINDFKNGLVTTDPVAADVALINSALALGNQPFPTWTARAASDCPLQVSPSAVVIQGTSFGPSTAGPNCWRFDWTVTNTGTLPLKEFYLDLEAGNGAQTCNNIADVTLTGWTPSFCYSWDSAAPSNWAVVKFTTTTALQSSQSSAGTLAIDVNGAAAVPANIAFWHPFVVPAFSIHAHATSYSPDCLGVNCAVGDFGPHIALDLHGRDQAPFWGVGNDWTRPVGGPGGVPTMSEWALATMAALLATCGFLLLRNRTA